MKLQFLHSVNLSQREVKLLHGHQEIICSCDYDVMRGKGGGGGALPTKARILVELTALIFFLQNF